jgi:hypothetical protein
MQSLNISRKGAKYAKNLFKKFISFSLAFFVPFANFAPLREILISTSPPSSLL